MNIQFNNFVVAKNLTFARYHIKLQSLQDKQDIQVLCRAYMERIREKARILEFRRVLS